MIGSALLDRLKPEAILINTARGPLLDEEALIAALQNGRIRGAALDVYDHEPLPHEHPLRQCQNALLLGHCGGWNDGSFVNRISQTVALIHAFLDGAPINVLNPEVLGGARR
jgi:phosphoglycerate dehydrogenase-like enzyme